MRVRLSLEAVRWGLQLPSQVLGAASCGGPSAPFPYFILPWEVLTSSPRSKHPWGALPCLREAALPPSPPLLCFRAAMAEGPWRLLEVCEQRFSQFLHSAQHKHLAWLREVEEQGRRLLER